MPTLFKQERKGWATGQGGKGTTSSKSAVTCLQPTCCRNRLATVCRRCPRQDQRCVPPEVTANRPEGSPHDYRSEPGIVRSCRRRTECGIWRSQSTEPLRAFPIEAASSRLELILHRPFRPNRRRRPAGARLHQTSCNRVNRACQGTNCETKLHPTCPNI